MFKYIVRNDGIQLVDMLRRTVANVYLCTDTDGDNDTVRVNPTRGICEYTDSRCPLTMLHGQYVFTPESFLDYLGSIAAWDKWGNDDSYNPMLVGANSKNNYYTILLRPSMDTRPLTELLEFPGNLTENWLKRHVTFRSSDD